MPRSSSDLAARPRQDALSAVLLDLRLSHGSYGRCWLRAPWGIELPQRDVGRFHFVASGHCWLRVADGEWQALKAGDAVLVPRGTRHLLTDRPGRATLDLDTIPVVPIAERTYDMHLGGKGDASLLFCCSVEFEGPAFGPLRRLLPEILTLENASDGETVPLLLRCMAQEITADRIGLATVLARLADVVIMQFVRSWVEGLDDSADGWVAAIRDPRIGRALAAIHSRPGDPWTIDSLAQTAGLSRSRFAQRFAALAGETPAKYLAKWRMHIAMVWLRRDRLGVAEVAHRLGYESEQSFSRAFRRIVNQSPSSIREAAPPR